MQRTSLVETYEPFLGRAAVEEFVAGGNVERYFDEHWRHATIAVSGSEIVGVAVLVGTLLDLLWVRPESRSQGIGSALMEVVERESERLTLEVWEVNRRAVAFYERRGFRVTHTVEDPEAGLVKLVMQKEPVR
jgi:ribosomal protein S18 acetylase RimI-like enzyme